MGVKIMNEFIDKEIENIDFGDNRLNKRLNTLVESFSQSPESSIPAACASVAEVKGVYRFFASDKVKVHKIQRSFFSATIERIHPYQRILILQDTSNMDFTTQKGKKDIGYLDSPLSQGIKMHSGLVTCPAGVPLGLICQEFWVRLQEEYGKKKERKNKPIKDKESQRWLDTVEVAENEIDESKEVIIIGDRESDIYDLFIQKRRKNIHLLMRAAQNRITSGSPRLLFDNISSKEVAGTTEIKVTRAKDRKERIAKLEIRFSQIEIKPPQYRKKENLAPVKLNVILASEVNAPEDVTPVKWLLLTTLPVNTFEEAMECIRLYSLRWLIERYHYVLKSGCKIEKLQLETKERLEKAIAVYCIVAWRLLYITYLSRIAPEETSSKVLKQEEWEALHCFVKKVKTPPNKAPTLKESVIMIAKLGGFLGRKGDGEPGVKVLWRGLKRLNDITESYLIFR